MGTNAAPGTAYFYPPADNYANISFFYHMYGSNVGTLSVQVKSKSIVISSGVVSAVADLVSTIVTI